ncbi:STAS domain-containing protein [Nocardia sp. NPDC056000]|uniref:STAS domain-containing protein n=1 Tax=Nocardia sp. NPDC056000 TaxID=3345674 RepID=UPI0035D84939
MNDPDQLLQVELDENAAIPVVTASGEIDVTSAPVLERVLRRALRAGTRTVVVDMTGVSFLGSAGITVLAAVAEECLEPRGRPGSRRHRGRGSGGGAFCVLREAIRLFALESALGHAFTGAQVIQVGLE